MAGIVTNTTVTISRGSTAEFHETGNHVVYTRASWADAWTAHDDLHCDEAVWVSAPSISTATLRWHYGRIAATGSPSFAEVLRKANFNRLYVKIAFRLRRVDGEWMTRTWYGVIEIDEDLLLGEVIDPVLQNRVATGEQTFTAYGFEHLLDQQFINRAWWDADDGGDVRELSRSVVFNRDGKKNRSPSQAAGVYHFAKTKGTAEWWSTRDMVEYLYHYFTPRDWNDFAWIPFAIDWDGMAEAAPNWDHPEVDPENRSLWSMLCSLIPRQRLTSFYLTVELSGEDETVILRPFTFIDTAVETTQEGEPIPANINQIAIVAPHDQSGEVSVKTTTVDRYDQVIARGARRRSVFTVSYQDSTLEPGWTTTEETEYEAGASGAAAYATASTDEQRRMNAEARAREALQNVYSRFVLPDGWDGTVYDGVGGTTERKVFPADGDELVGVEQYDPELAIERTLPLLEGVDYSGNLIATQQVDETVGSQAELAPLVFWGEPSSLSYTNVEKRAKDSPTLGSDEQWDWSAAVVVPDNDRGFRLSVSGAPQHVIDYPGFAPLAADEDLGQHDWRDMLATVSMQDDRYAEGRYPADDDIPPGDYIQRLWIEAGDGYRCDYVVPGTVVDVDDAGDLVRSDGGFLHDDRDELEVAAKIAYLYYSRERKVLALATDQLDERFEIGQLVTTLNTQDNDGQGSHYFAIATPITEIRITTAWGTSDAPPAAPRMRIMTDAGQLDALQFVSPAEPVAVGELRRHIDELMEQVIPGRLTRDSEPPDWYRPGGFGAGFFDPRKLD